MHTFDRDPDAGPFFGPRKEIQGLPTLVFYRSGYAISKQEGYQNPATIETWVPWQNNEEFDELICIAFTRMILFRLVPIVYGGLVTACGCFLFPEVTGVAGPEVEEFDTCLILSW